MSGDAQLVPARLRPRDLLRLSSVGIRTRKLRAALSALGIAIGVAAIVAVLGLSASSQAGLLAEISKLGTNLLTVTNGQFTTANFGATAATNASVEEVLLPWCGTFRKSAASGACSPTNADSTRFSISPDRRK